MARDFFVDINLNGRQIQNVRVHAVGALPSGLTSTDEGRFVYLTTDDRLYFWDGGAWQDAGRSSFDRDRANHTGTQTASTISDFNTAVRTNRLDQMAAPTAPVSFNNQRITSLADPTAATDAANKQYVDGVAQGLSFKDSVRASSADGGSLFFDLSGGVVVSIQGTQVNGVTLVLGDRILLRHVPAADGTQTSTPSNQPGNGLYVVTSVSTNLGVVRADDMNTASEVDGAFVFVEDGSLAGTSYVTTSEVTTLNTDPISWTQFAGGADLTATAPLRRTGNVLSADRALIPASPANGGLNIAVDPGVARVVLVTFKGDGTTTDFFINYGSGYFSYNPIVRVMRLNGGVSTEVETDVIHGGANTNTTIRFGSAPAAGVNYEVVLIG